MAAVLAEPTVKRWLQRYPPAPRTDADFRRETGIWTVHVYSGRAGEIARGAVDDKSGRVLSAWAGPQVAWTMARGRDGAFGGKTLNRPAVWLAFCAVFLVGLVNWRAPFRLRTLDLVVLLSFSVSLWFFNQGRVFAATALAYPPLVYLLGRCLRRGLVSPRSMNPVVWPTWVLLAATLFLVGFRVGLNVQAERGVIDVGYASVAGADRILHGQAPYGHMPKREGVPCGAADSDGMVRDRVQTNGRCETAIERGDTYGPVVYLSYVPSVLLLGWSGRWDALPAAHLSAVLFDSLVLAGLFVLGLRLAGAALGATLAFAWAAYPFTAYAMNSNSNDALMPVLLVWALVLVARPASRGALVVLAGWTKFAALALVPLWLTYPVPPSRRSALRFLAGAAAATLAAFAVLLLEPGLWPAIRTFADRTFGFQIGRDSPFALWGWGQYHARGVPDLSVLQHVLQAAVVLLAFILAVRPRRKTALQLAASSAAVLLGVQIVLGHWSYLYLPWGFPFVAVALLGWASTRERRT